MRKNFFLAVILTLSLACHAQERKYSTFYYQRATLFEELPVTLFSWETASRTAPNGRSCFITNISRTAESVVISAWEYMTAWMLS